MQGRSGTRPQQGHLGVTSHGASLIPPTLSPCCSSCPSDVQPFKARIKLVSYLRLQARQAPGPFHFLLSDGRLSVPPTLPRTLAPAVPLRGHPWPSPFQIYFLGGPSPPSHPKQPTTCPQRRCMFRALQSTWCENIHAYVYCQSPCPFTHEHVGLSLSDSPFPSKLDRCLHRGRAP